MSDYTCGPCGSHDRTRYTRCYHPGCPDGHDQPGVYYASKPRNEGLSYRGKVWIAALLFCGAFWFGVFWIMRAALS